jgi:cytochrome b subunit of formate dehydrogenase
VVAAVVAGCGCGGDDGRASVSLDSTSPFRRARAETPVRRVRRSSFGLTVLAVLLAAGRALAQENADCLTCHGDKDLTTKRGGRTVSLFVDEKAFAAGVHGKTACIGCHQDLKGVEFPHAEHLARPSCTGCHDRENSDHAAGLHGRAEARGEAVAPRCADCHGRGHEIVPVRDPRSPVAPAKIPFLCGRCHHEGTAVSRRFDIPQDRILENYTESIHGEALLKKGLTVAATCVSCHTPHLVLPHTDARSSIARANIAATCTKCHSAIEQVHRKIIRGELWEKAPNTLPSCPDCHQPHKVRKVFYEQGMADKDCLTCHARKDLKAASDGRSLWVDAAELAGSKHTNRACSQCHTEVRPSLVRPCATVTHKVDCGACHAEVVVQFAKSVHGQLKAKGDDNAPSCRDCHGTHGVMGRRDPASPTFSRSVPALCGRCHQEGKKAAVRYKGTEHEIIQHYSESIHGKGLLKSGLLVTAMCTDCHTAHAILPHADPDSSVNNAHLPETCGRCHHGIEEAFEKSIHSVKVSHSKKKLPVCDDCHTAHTIRRTDAVGFKIAITNTCGKCHAEVTKTYFDTYHGKVSQLGYAKTAKCYDCHGAHDILPPSDPRSHLSRENVVGTCRQCHSGATRRFAGYLTHATHHDPAKYPFLFWTFWGMTGLLLGTFLVGGAHTLMWLPRAVQMRREHVNGIAVDGKALQYVRFSRLNRMLHIAMIVSFMSLALTGLTLKFSYTSWAVGVSRVLGGFENAGFIHRSAACVMFAIFATHLISLVRGKRRDAVTWKQLLLGPSSMIPGWQDAKDAWHSIKWFLGLGPRPSYGRWTYWEKFDYFAVFWGIFVIGSTGLMLWFPELFTRLLPGSLINVATIVHSDEALLAVGFIFTVHFFNTHLRPEKFPMDIVVFTGRMPVEEFKRDKPAEYQALVESGTLEDHLAEPYQPVVIKAVRAFGWTALTVGFLIVVWIIYAMLFAYQ